MPPRMASAYLPTTPPQQAWKGWALVLVALLWVLTVVKLSAPEQLTHYTHRQASSRVASHHGSPSVPRHDGVVRRSGQLSATSQDGHLAQAASTKASGSDEVRQAADLGSAAHHHTICAHRGYIDTPGIPISRGREYLCDIDLIAASGPTPRDSMKQICCGDYDVFFSSDGVPFVGHPRAVSELLGLNSTDDLLTHQDRDLTSRSSLLAHDPAGAVLFQMRDLANFISNIHARLKSVGCAPSNSSDSRSGSGSCGSHVFFTFEPKVPSRQARDAHVFLQQLGTLTEAIAKELSSDEALCGIVIDPRADEVDALRESLPGELKFVVPLKDKWLGVSQPEEAALGSGGGRDMVPAHAGDAASSIPAQHGSPKHVAAVDSEEREGPQDGQRHLSRSFQLCQMLVTPPLWAHMVAPSLRFIERCIERHGDDLHHAIANYRRHGKSHRQLPPMEVWLVDSEQDVNRLYAVREQFEDLVPAFYVSNVPLAINQVLNGERG